MLTWPLTFWSLALGPFVPQKQPNTSKSNCIFHWKLRWDRALPWFWLIQIAQWITSFLVNVYFFGLQPSSGGKLGSNFHQKCKLFVRLVSVKLWVFQNILREICTIIHGPNFNLIWRFLLEWLPPNLPKWVQLGLEPKKVLVSFG